MRETKLIMGMPITIEVLDLNVTNKAVSNVFDYFSYIDNKFSTYKETSEITRINKGQIAEDDYSSDMKMVLALCEETRKITGGYFDIFKNGKFDPSGLVKGWAILHAANLLEKEGFENYYVDAGGDIQVHGKNNSGRNWVIGIRNPFNREEIVKAIAVKSEGIATSGTYIRGQHIYNPFRDSRRISDIVSLTVIGPNIYEADRFATSAFAMGKGGINFIEGLPGFEAYMIDSRSLASFTSGFTKYVVNSNEKIN